MIIWVKTPKCAGTSLKIHFTEKRIMPGKVKCILPEHKDIFKKNNKSLWDSAFKFAIVRNPFDKLVSAWHYFEHLRCRPLYDVLLNLPRKEKSLRVWHHITQTQVSILSDINGFMPYDRIIKVEYLNRDLNEVLKKHNIPPVVLPRKNKTKRDRDYRKYFDRKTRMLAEKLYWMDLNLFGYEF